MGSMKKRFDRDDLVGGHIKAKSDKALNRTGEAYNRAKITVRQNQKEEELKQGALQNMMIQQQVMMQKQELIDMSAKIDLQQKMLENKIAAAQQPPMPFAGLPPLQQLPQIPLSGDNIPPEMRSDFGNAEGAAMYEGAHARPMLTPEGAGLPSGDIPVSELGQHAAPELMPQHQQYIHAPVEATAPPFM